MAGIAATPMGSMRNSPSERDEDEDDDMMTLVGAKEDEVMLEAPPIGPQDFNTF